MDLHDRDQRSVEIVVLGLFGIEHFDRECSTGDSENGTTVEISSKLFSVKGSRSNDDFQVGSSLDRFCQDRVVSYQYIPVSSRITHSSADRTAHLSQWYARAPRPT